MLVHQVFSEFARAERRPCTRTSPSTTSCHCPLEQVHWGRRRGSGSGHGGSLNRLRFLCALVSLEATHQYIIEEQTTRTKLNWWDGEAPGEVDFKHHFLMFIPIWRRFTGWQTSFKFGDSTTTKFRNVGLTMVGIHRLIYFRQFMNFDLPPLAGSVGYEFANVLWRFNAHTNNPRNRVKGLQNFTFYSIFCEACWNCLCERIQFQV